MRKWVLAGILTLAFVLRTVGLSNFPPGFTPDEVSFGYDAYSILKTGKDQWGKPFPLVLESFGDFKSSLYAYLAIPSVAVFGLNKFAVRLPNAILGTLAVLVTYLLANRLFNQKVGNFASLLLAISPWHVMLSRGAFEANLATFFLPLAVLLFLNKKFVLSGLIFGLNLFSYHSARLVTPLLFFFLLYLYRKELGFSTLLHSTILKSKAFPLIGIFLFFLVLMVYTLTQGAGTRATERSISQGALEAAFPERIRSSTLFHNKYFVIVDRFFTNYLTYFSPQFLFSSGPAEGTYGMIPGRGVLYWFTIPFFIGLRKVYDASKSEHKREISFLLFWALAAVVPAAMATGVGYHANRVAAMMPAIDIALAVGAVEFFGWLKNKKVLIISYLLFLVACFIFFLEDYFIQSPYKVGKSMLHGNLEAAEWAVKNIDSTRQVIVDKSLSEPHIYFAFAEGIDPIVYQEATKNWNYETWVDQMPEYSLGRFKFKDISLDDFKEKGALIGKPEDFKIEIEPSKVFYYPGGEAAIYGKVN